MHHPAVYSPPPETLYVQFYDPWARDEFSPTQMKLATATPGTNEINHLLELIQYSPTENQILEPKPYRYRLPPGEMQWIIHGWERITVDPKTGEFTSAVEEADFEVEVVYDDDEEEDQVVLRPVRMSRFGEVFEGEGDYDSDYEYGDGDDSDYGDGYGYGYGDYRYGDWNPPAGDFSFLDPDQFAVESSDDEDYDEEEEGGFRIDVDEVLDSAVKMVGKAQLKMWKVKREWVSVGKRLKKSKERWVG